MVMYEIIYQQLAQQIEKATGIYIDRLSWVELVSMHSSVCR